MTRPQPDEAAAALEASRRHQDRVVAAVTIPWWYWLAVAALVLAVGIAVDSQRPLAIATAVVALVLIVGGLSAWLIFGGWGRPQVHRSLLGQRGALAIDSLVAIVVISALAIGFTLQAIGVHIAATIATAVAAIELMTLGPLLNRRLTHEMQAHEVQPSA
jgi:predicted membrane protein